MSSYFNVLKGPDPKDSTCLSEEDLKHIRINSPQKNGVTNPKEIVVGIPREYLCEGMSSEVVDAWSEVADLLEKEGIKVVSVSLPHTRYSITCYQVLNPCEGMVTKAFLFTVLFENTRCEIT